VTLQAVLFPNLQTSPLQGNGDNEPECVILPCHTLKNRRRGPAHVFQSFAGYLDPAPCCVVYGATVTQVSPRHVEARTRYEVSSILQDDSHLAAPAWNTESPSPIERKCPPGFDAPCNKSSQPHSEASRSFQRHRRSLSASRSSTSRQMSR
jgi:hypothetical protein